MYIVTASCTCHVYPFYLVVDTTADEKGWTDYARGPQGAVEAWAFPGVGMHECGHVALYLLSSLSAQL